MDEWFYLYFFLGLCEVWNTEIILIVLLLLIL